MKHPVLWTDSDEEFNRQIEKYPYTTPLRNGPVFNGVRSNSTIRARNGGVRHQFEDDIGGCSANYK